LSVLCLVALCAKAQHPTETVSISISPKTAKVSLSNSAQFITNLTGTMNRVVTWSISPSTGAGTINQLGKYTAPGVLPSNPRVTITATSLQNRMVSGSARITITSNESVSVSPQNTSVNLSGQQSFAAAVSGSSTNNAVTWSAVSGTINASTGVYTAPATLPAGGRDTVTATSMADSTKKGIATVTITSNETVSVSPQNPSISLSGQQSFTAAVSGSSTNTAVTWSAVSGIINASTGVYTAPAKLPVSGTDTVTATSLADSRKMGTATIALTSDPPDPPPSIATNGLSLAYIGQPYLAVLTGLNGAPPYTWSANADALPAGLSLDPTSGEISGTPTQGGLFSTTIKVTDADGASASKTFNLSVFEQPLDQYGGLINKPCPDGAQAHFYAQKINSRWHLCTPAGNAFWMNGVYDIDATDSGTDYQGIALNNVINAKYATGFTTNSTLNWALQSVKRIQSWGFNTIAEDAVAWTLPVAVDSDWHTSDNTIPVKLPFIAIAAPSWYAYTNLNNYASGPVKDIVYGIKPNVFQGYRSHFADIWTRISASGSRETWRMISGFIRPTPGPTMIT
jgi:hypothetical protein